MIDTSVLNYSYVDCFGNEVDVYEQTERYTVWYYGYLFEGDNENGFNEIKTDDIDYAMGIYNFYGDMIHIDDGMYDVTFSNGEWESN